MTAKPEVVGRRLLGMQLCVPKAWGKKRILAFAERENPAGTENGWNLCEEGDDALLGDPARVQCQEKENFVHVIVGV